MGKARGTSSQGRLDALMAVARAPVVPPATVVGGWVPGDPAAAPPAAGPDGDTPASPARPVRRQVGAAAAVAALALAVVVALLAWVRAGSAGQVLDVPPRPSASSTGVQSGAVGRASPPAGGPGAAPPASASVPALVVVDVEGRVRRPGLVRLPAGSRVADAVRAAGGATAGAVLARLNLARVLVDGEQVLVPGPDDPVPAVGAGPAGSGAGPPAPLDLNSATVESFDTLPGVGPVLAGRIVAWRTEHGRFTSVDELGEVPGIGPKALERLRPLVRV
jgi:competence protein ComEA